jgi:hypothetical protein
MYLPVTGDNVNGKNENLETRGNFIRKSLFIMNLYFMMMLGVNGRAGTPLPAAARCGDRALPGKSCQISLRVV